MKSFSNQLMIFNGKYMLKSTKRGCYNLLIIIILLNYYIFIIIPLNRACAFVELRL